VDKQAFAEAVADSMEEQSVASGSHGHLVAAGIADYQKYLAVALKVADQVQATVGVFEPAQVKLYAGIALAALHAVANGLPAAS
jgi:hypothetical protein